MLIEFVGNVITQPFGRIARQIPRTDVEVQHHGVDQIMQVLLGNSRPDVLVAHVTLDYFIVEGWDRDAAMRRMEEYCQAACKFASAGHSILIINTLAGPTRRIVGAKHIARQRLVSALNEMLFRCADECSWVSIADTAGVLARCGHDVSISAINDAVMRLPYTNQVMPALMDEYARAIGERFTARKKVLLLDADNTLWGGVIGEDGVEGIQVGDQYPGILYRRFQSELLELRATGLLLCLVTKNNEPDVREAFERADMPLKWDHFAAIRANWEPKSVNIEAIAAQLNVGVDSMLFVDDNPVELAEVAARFPMLASRQFSVREAADALQWIEALPDIGIWSPSAEDMAKSDQYRQEARRQEQQAAAASIEDYIASLDMVIEAGLNRTEQVKRIAQLTNKTNQFNLTTRRYSESEIMVAMKEGQVFDFRVRDRFGDMGIIAVVIVRNGEIETFLMSCRALGRRIEDDIIKHVISHTSEKPIKASYIRTAKNPMVADFYDRMGFTRIGDGEDVRLYAYDTPSDLELTNQLTEVF
ncbi:HAD family hydrolase [Sphingopyxis sp. DBS4]|uniref:HAD-IIIC family phosphatase n=1 Tax=Sphingopyxis sp. DBS4 TaxID=2968500 RepID=UPI00214AE68F|nr:HAD-IIIC family phosphatase [Sphingopyxis sp. DBS4]